MIGSQLGQYQILELIGAGAQASVYRAYQPGMERYVAIKVLPRHFAADPTFVQRFHQEARLIARLEHAHILPVYDFGEDQGVAYLAMRYLEAGTLKDIMAERRLPLAEVGHLLCQIGSALDYAHRQGVVHRDLKPANIMVDREGNSYLTDFGVAKIIGDATGLTASGTIGTPAYMSPEQGMSGRIDGRSDIYSLGVMLFQLATNTLPFDADTAMAVILQHINDPVPSVRDQFPEIPVGVEAVIHKAMAKSPDERYQSGAEMCDALRASLGGVVTQVVPLELQAGAEQAIQTMAARREELAAQVVPIPDTTPRGVPMRRGRWLLLGLAGLAALVLVAVVTAVVILGVLRGPGQQGTAAEISGEPAGQEPEAVAGQASLEQGQPAGEEAVGAPPAEPPSGEMPYIADFEGTAPLNGWAVGGDWVVTDDFYDFAGGPVLSGNHALFSETLGSNLTVLGLLQPQPQWATAQDYVITMRVKFRRSGADARLLFSESGSGTYYALDFGTSNVALRRFEGGEDTLPPEFTNIPLELGRWYDLWIWRHAGHVAAYVNGRWFLQTLNQPSLQPGTIGLETIGEGGVFIDDITVTATSPASEDFEDVALPDTWNVVNGLSLVRGEHSQMLEGANLDTDQVGPITDELSDFNLTCQVQSQQGTSALQFRRGAGGQYELVFEGGNVYLDRIVNRGQDVRLAEARNVYGPSAQRTVSVQALGSHISILMDGLPVIELDDPGGHAAGTLAVEYGQLSSLLLDDCIIYSPVQPANAGGRFVYDLWESMFNTLGSTARPALRDDFSRQCTNCWVGAADTPADGPGDYEDGYYSITAGDTELWWLLSDAPAFLAPALTTGPSPSTNFIGTVDVRVQQGSGWVGIRGAPDRTGVVLEQYRVRLSSGPEGNTASVEAAGTFSQEVYFTGPWPNFEATGDGWHKVMVVAQGDTLAFFVNGSYLTSVPVTNPDRLLGTLSIGASPNSSAAFDNVELWDLRGLGAPARNYP